MTLSLSAALGQYPHTAPLRDGRVTSPQVHLELQDIVPVNRAFRAMVNDLTYDVSEMALVTLMLAKSKQRPLRALPVVLLRQSAHQMLTTPHESPIRRPQDLVGKTIGVRAYTQTTGTWVRGILQHQFGLDLPALSWLTFEPAHVDGYADPPNCRRAAAGQTLLDMVLNGQVDAAVGLEPHPGVRPIIAAAEQEFVQQTGVRPINHVLTVKEDLAQQYPWLTSELFFMFSSARERAITEDQADPAEYGLEQNRPAIELLARYAKEQGITPHAFAADALFEVY